MLPYLATIHDSLREAISSRVLWIVLGLITLLLVALAPLGYREDLTVGLQGDDIRDPQSFIVRLREAAKENPSSPARHIWSLLDEQQRTKLESLALPADDDPTSGMEYGRAIRGFRKALQEAMKQPEFYDPEAWAETVPLSDELDDFKDKKAEELSAKELQRRNRLWLEAAFPDDIQVSLPTSIQLFYAGSDFGPPQVLKEEQFVKTFKSLIVFVMSWFIGPIGILVAIIVSSPIVPQMFDPGSLNLILSKPISRWLLFLAKFLGGCSFVAVATIYLVGGLCLILGWRFNIWDVKLLWSIPLYLFAFSIVYSVSALAGVIWRHTIVSIACAILFWVFCFCVGFAKSKWDTNVIALTRIAQLVPAGDSLIAVNEMGICHVWNDGERQWKRVFLSNEQKQILPAYYVMPTIPRQLKPVGPVFDTVQEKLVMTVFSMRRSRAMLYSGKKETNWEPKSNVAVPPMGTFQFLSEPSGKLLAASSMGLFRLEGDVDQAKEPLKLFGFQVPLPAAGPFLSVGPDEPMVLTQPADVAVDARNGALVAYSRSTVHKLTLSESGKYERQSKREFDKEDPRAALLAIGGGTIMLARDDGVVLALDSSSLETRQEFQPEKENQPKLVVAAPGGNWFAVGFHTGRLFLYNVQEGTLSLADVAGQGTISAALFTQENELLVADRTDRVTRYELPSGRVLERISPPADRWTNLYRYILVPFHTILPKPSELDNTLNYLLFDTVTKGTNPNQKDLTAIQARFDPWGPLWSSAIFMVVILVAACIYVEWQEF